MNVSKSAVNPQRRRIVQAAAAVGAVSAISPYANVHAQTARKVTFSLPWVVNGANFFPIIGRERGFFKSRGLELEIQRGFGSPAATQAVANGKFDFGLVFTPGITLNAARGLFVQAVATFGYDTLMGVAIPENSPIRRPSDLEGKTVGMVLTSAEAPFFTAWLERNKVDNRKITRQTMDSQLIERSLINKQVDAITAVGTSSLPLFQSLGFDTRFMPWSETGLEFYSHQIITRPDTIAADAGLVQAVVDGLLESVVYTLRNPEESVEIITKVQPEIAAVKGGRDNFALALAIAQSTMVAEEAIKNGMGFADMKKIQSMADLTVKFALQDGKPFTAEQIVTNRFAGKLRLSAAEWDSIRKNTAKVRKLLTT